MTATTASAAGEAERPPGATVLELDGITKRFGDTVAVDNASLRLERGRVHALIGENGAGKTTLMRIAFGLVSPDAGRVVVPGAREAITSPGQAIAAGLGMVHQHFTNVPAMTVAENVALGSRGRFDASVASREVIAIGVRTGLALDPHALVADLPVGAQQRLEIVKALAHNARILILDEPTAVLAPAETDELLRWLRTAADQGTAVVLITHKLREALAIADDVTVLRRGRVVLSASMTDVTLDSLSAAVLGEEAAPVEPVGSSTATSDVVVTAEKVSIIDERGVTRVRDASFELRGGEILGIAGVEGAGQRELLRALAARAPISSGVLRIPQSVGFVPEDRHRDALVLEFALAENVALSGAGARRGLMPWRALRTRTRALIEEFDVRGGRVDTRARALSGGNQQKLVLARELDGAPRLLVVENPTRGLDIRGTRAIHDRLRRVAAAGAAVVAYSSDIDEVIALATRVLVLHGGTVRECPLDREVVGKAMLGVA